MSRAGGAAGGGRPPARPQGKSRRHQALRWRRRVAEEESTMKIVVLTVALGFFVAAPALGQAGAVTAGFNVGVAIPLTEDLNEQADQDRALAGHVTVGLVRALAVRGEIGQSRFKPSGDLAAFCAAFDLDCRLKVNHYSIGLQWGGFGTRGALGLSRARVLPYGFIALGSYRATAEDLDADEERRTGFNAGFGLNIRFTDNVGLQVDVHAHSVRPDADDERQYWVTPSVGVWVGF
jgi:hypothetical protein